MAKFVEVPTLRIGRNHLWVLVTPLVYHSDIWPRPITVPAEFQTDLASIPRIFTPLVPVNGDHRASAILHDWLVGVDGFDRRLADKLFLEAMKVAGVKAWRRYAMYAAVSVMTTWKKLVGRKSE
jgi:hypothetical protein